jgi:hypothetical protein
MKPFLTQNKAKKIFTPGKPKRITVWWCWGLGLCKYLHFRYMRYEICFPLLFFLLYFMPLLFLVHIARLTFALHYRNIFHCFLRMIKMFLLSKSLRYPPHTTGKHKMCCWCTGLGPFTCQRLRHNTRYELSVYFFFCLQYVKLILHEDLCPLCTTELYVLCCLLRISTCFCSVYFTPQGITCVQHNRQSDGYIVLMVFRTRLFKRLRVRYTSW